MNAVESLERDVVLCGAPLGDARLLGKCYERALRSQACADWIELYVGTFVTLLRNAHRTRIADGAAAARLFALVGDDLGRQLFDEDACRQLERALLQSAA